MTKIEIELPEFDGFEYTGEYRRPESGEYFLGDSNNICKVPLKMAVPYHILKPVDKWIPANIEYIQEHYKWGDEVPIRFKDVEELPWAYDTMGSFDDFAIYKYREILEVRND